jgi:hypothetical protein
VLSLKNNSLGTKEAGKALGEMLKVNSVLKELDLSGNTISIYEGGDGPGFAQELALGIKDNGGISSINLLKNHIPVEQAQELVKIMHAKLKLITLCGLSKEETELDFSGRFGCGIKQQDLGAGDAVLIANDISDMGGISIVNVLSNSIGDEQAQELIKVMQSKERLTTLCGFSGQEIQLDLSKKGLSSACAVLVANEMKDIKGLQVANISQNEIQFSNELCMTLLRSVVDSRSGLRIQVEGNDFSAVNKHTMEFVLLELFGKEDIPTEVNVESAGLTGSLPPPPLSSDTHPDSALVMIYLARFNLLGHPI